MLELLIFAFIYVFGIVSSYDDIRAGIIRNRNLFIAFLFGLIFNFVFFMSDSSSEGDLDYVLDVVVNCMLSFFVGFILWIFKIWTAGDAKLFTVYSLLIPLGVYVFGYVPYFPAFTFLLNSFLLLLAFIVLTTPLSFEKLKQEGLRKLIDMPKLLSTFLYLFGFMWFFNRLFEYLSVNPGLGISLFILLSMRYLLTRVKCFAFELVSIVFSLARILFGHETVLSPGFIEEFTVLFLFFFIIRRGFSLFNCLKIKKEVMLSDLKPGMIITDPLPNQYLKSLGESDVFDPDACITGSHVHLLQKLYSEGKLSRRSTWVKQTLPFAPFLFLGCVLTVYCKGDFVSFLLYVL